MVKAMTEGFKAFYDGLSLSDNPYDFGCFLYGCWETGYKQGEKELCQTYSI